MGTMNMADVFNLVKAARTGDKRVDRYGRNALMLVIASDNLEPDKKLEMVERMVGSEIFDLDDQDDDKYTALMYVALNYDKEILEVLVDAGANPRMVNGKGQTAKGILVSNGRDRYAEAITFLGEAERRHDERMRQEIMRLFEKPSPS